MHISSSLVSVIMIDPGGHQTIDRAVRSLLRQDHAEWELLVVDSGMSRASRQSLETWLTVDSRIRVASPEIAMGRYASLNVGIRRARAPFVTYLECDCEYLANYLGRGNSDIHKLVGRNSDIHKLVGRSNRPGNSDIHKLVGRSNRPEFRNSDIQEFRHP
jgi:glycosyltransferase involved in cell wall biosynthesis